MSQMQARQNPRQQINAPFRAKSAGVSLVVVFIVGMYYFANALPLFPSPEAVPEGAISLFITTIALIIVAEIVLQIVLFIGAGQIEDRTRRDDTITALASRNAYLVLTLGVFATFGSIFAGFTPFAVGSVLLLAFLLAEVVKFASQVLHYQRLAQSSESVVIR